MPKAAASPSAKPKATAKARRDPVKTRAKILQAATAEFAAKGYSGARTEQIARRAKSNIRMLYHYFGGKDALYVCVLEEVLANLRHEELQLDFSDVDPVQGLIQLFDFIDGHFLAHPELLNLLAFENLNRAQHLKRSTRIPQMASPVLDLIRTLLQRGEQTSVIRQGIDPLHLYVSMVSLAFFAKSNAHTLSRIFQAELLAPTWQQAHQAQAHHMLATFLAPSPPTAAEAKPKSMSKPRTTTSTRKKP